ncbi:MULTISPECIES: hypothetical protein [Helicobacter]|uniref:Uncharacterized protein n=1 Tax=Helicobacter typhlonius TaxID=76936 RepID=A0A099UCX9_9HELI|nr:MULTISPECIES: hypothetical protein [Helicobacter]TLD78238.1 hypothetical protein LS75_007250 [Helicobacter typhlonius]TLD86890.1 hypothetical protein LS67_007580 [Helicobacter sp. MIT 03-1616]CUU40723.1 Hypothetical protein BN2458_PEG1840 [Helicobacter typhlonius]
MKIFEYMIALSLVAILFALSPKPHNHSLEIAHITFLSHLRILQLTALSDDSAFLQGADTRDMLISYPSLNASSLLTHHHNAMWQVQFHLGKIYTTHSYSLYIDTPRNATSTHFDARPMAGDIILKNMDRKCLSAYNNTNTAQECKDNALPLVRLGEYFGVEHMLLESDSFCKERQGARIYFDRYGVPYCGDIPTPLQSPFKITLLKGGVAKTLCILPQSGFITSKC